MPAKQIKMMMVCQADTRWWKAGAHDSAKQGRLVSTGPYEHELSTICFRQEAFSGQTHYIFT